MLEPQQCWFVVDSWFQPVFYRDFWFAETKVWHASYTAPFGLFSDISVFFESLNLCRSVRRAHTLNALHRCLCNNRQEIFFQVYLIILHIWIIKPTFNLINGDDEISSVHAKMILNPLQMQHEIAMWEVYCCDQLLHIRRQLFISNTAGFSKKSFYAFEVLLCQWKCVAGGVAISTASISGTS